MKGVSFPMLPVSTSRRGDLGEAVVGALSMDGSHGCSSWKDVLQHKFCYVTPRGSQTHEAR